MTVKKQFSDEQMEWIRKQNRFADVYLIVGLVIGLIAIAAIICSAVTAAFAQVPACTVYYHAGVVTCDRPPVSAATLTATTLSAATKPAREQSSDSGYPAPGDPEPSATLVMPYPPPISGDPAETAIPTSGPRPTPTLAPDCSIPPNASVLRCENGTGVPVVTYTPAP